MSKGKSVSGAMISVFAVAAMTLVIPPHLRAQYVTVYQSEVSVVPKLAGRVVGGIDNVAVADARVELRSSDWKTVLKTAKADANGDFSFGAGSIGKLFYIQVSSPGFDPYQLRVRISQHAKSKLVIHLVIAT